MRAVPEKHVIMILDFTLMLTINNRFLTWNVFLFEILLVLHDVSDVNEGVGHVLTVSILVVFWGFTHQREPDPERS